jgi:hypothetical protein
MDSFQHSIDVLNLSLLSSRFELMSLKKTFVPCLKTDLIKTPITKRTSRLYLRPSFSRTPLSYGALSTTKVGLLFAALREALYEDCGERVPGWEGPHGRYFVPIKVYKA